MEKLEKALFDAGWSKETIDCFFKSDPVTPPSVSFSSFEVKTDTADKIDFPKVSDSSSLVFKINN